MTHALVRSVLACALGCSGCVGARTPIPERPTADDVLTHGSVLWVAAHPDDEAMAGPVLARACVGGVAPCHFVVMTRGDGGECLLPEGCKPDLGTVRHGELLGAARLYRATLEHYDFFNAPLPMSSFPSRPELERRWLSQGDPAGVIARAIRRFRPRAIVTLEPSHGFTGHPEHQAAARFAIAGARVAADPKATSTLVQGEPPHRVERVYQVVSRYWFMVAAGDGMDDLPFHHTIDGDGPCGGGRDGDSRSCVDVQRANTRPHRSQFSDMESIRTATRWWGTSYLREVDPWSPAADALIAELGTYSP